MKSTHWVLLAAVALVLYLQSRNAPAAVAGPANPQAGLGLLPPLEENTTAIGRIPPGQFVTAPQIDEGRVGVCAIGFNSPCNAPEYRAPINFPLILAPTASLSPSPVPALVGGAIGSLAAVPSGSGGGYSNATPEVNVAGASRHFLYNIADVRLAA